MFKGLVFRAFWRLGFRVKNLGLEISFFWHLSHDLNS